MRIRNLLIKIAFILAVATVAFFIGIQFAKSNAKPTQTESVIITTPESTLLPMPEPIQTPTITPAPSSTVRLYKVTAYCPCAKRCGKSDGITDSGVRAKEGITVAAEKELAFGTQVYIEGIGIRTVQDRGGAIKNSCLDLFFERHETALQLGAQWLLVEIVEK